MKEPSHSRQSELIVQLVKNVETSLNIVCPQNMPGYFLRRSKILVLLLLLCTTLACSPEQTVGQGQAAIENGTSLSPVLEELAVLVETGRGGKCSGTILPSGQVLTAAHCWGGFEVESLNSTTLPGLEISATAYDETRNLALLAGTFYVAQASGYRVRTGFIIQSGHDSFSFTILGDREDSDTNIRIMAIALDGDDVYISGSRGAGESGVAVVQRLRRNTTGSNTLTVVDTHDVGENFSSATAMAIRVDSSFTQPKRISLVVEVADGGPIRASVFDLDALDFSNQSATEEIYTTLMEHCSIAVLSDNTVVVGGTYIGAVPEMKLVAVERETIGGIPRWSAQEHYWSGPSASRLVDMTVYDANIVSLVESGPTFATQTLTLWSDLNWMGTRIDASPFALDEHYHSAPKSPYRHGTKSVEARSVGAVGTGSNAKIYVAGLLKSSTGDLPEPMVMGFKSSLVPDKNFAVRGTLISTKGFSEIAPIVASTHIVHLPAWNWSEVASLLSYDKRISKGIVRGVELQHWDFAKGVDLALATPITPLKAKDGVSVLPTFLLDVQALVEGETITCTGVGGSDVVQEGEFKVQPFAEDDIYNRLLGVTPPLYSISGAEIPQVNSIPKIVGGDSGGGCFIDPSSVVANQQLGGVWVSSLLSEASAQAKMVRGAVVDAFLRQHVPAEFWVP